jgi:hypothetical protein
MRLQNDIVDQFHEIIVIIVVEEILGLNGHQPGDESEGHSCVFMQQLFQNLENASTSDIGGSSITSA